MTLLPGLSWRRGRFALPLLLLFPAGSLLAVMPTTWTQQSTADFEKGRPDGVAVVSRGGLQLARTVKEIPLKELQENSQPFLWSQAIDSRGNLYVGSGNDGKIFKVSKDGHGSLFYATAELAVQALAVDPRDNLYVGTSPDGKVYRLSPEGKPDVWFDPEERYIWSLAVDRSGNLFVATGEHGIIYKVTDKGKGSPFFDSPDSHIAALAFDRQGNILAGTSGKGLVYRISPDGKGTVLYDTSLREVNALAVDPAGHVFASAIQMETPLPRGAGAKPAGIEGPVQTAAVTSPPTMERLEAEASPPDAGLVSPLPSRRTRSALYRVDPDGIAAQVWSSEEETIFSLAVADEKEIYLGTGDSARIRRLDEHGGTTLLAKLPATQVTSLVAGADGTLFAATSNAGGIYSLAKDVTDAGTYVSPPRDATSLARWGQIGWIGEVPSGTHVEVSTRSGNSAVPDDTWSDWSPPYSAAAGSKVVSPSARFIQWKARLSKQAKGSSPFLESVSLTYLPSNLAPRVEKVEVNPAGVILLKPPAPLEPDSPETAFSRPPAPPEGTEFATPYPAPVGKRIFQKGMRSVTFVATDPNDDVLRYDLFFRGEGEKDWKPLVRGWRDTYFSWDSTLLPDGRYRIRVLASDAASNPPAETRTGEEMSAVFMVDNTPPRIEAVARKEGGGFVVEVKAIDGVSPIRSLEYSLDASRWTAASPADGIADSFSETFRITVDRLAAGEHTLLVKSTDAEGNVGTEKVPLTGG